MKIIRHISVSKRALDQKLQSGSMIDRIKMDTIQAAAVEYYEKNRDNIELKELPEKTSPQQITYEFQFVILSEAEIRKLLEDFQTMYSAMPGVGSAKVADAMKILIGLLVVNG